MNLLRILKSVQLIQYQKKLGALIIPKFAIRYLKRLKRIINAIFYSLPFVILSWLKAAVISSLVKYLALYRALKVLRIREIRQRFLIVMLFKPQQLTETLIPPPGFLASSIRVAAGEVLVRIKPLAKQLLRNLQIIYSLSQDISLAQKLGEQ